jgi:hypothetical protein
MYRKVFFATVGFLLVLIMFGKDFSQTSLNHKGQTVADSRKAGPMLLPKQISKQPADLIYVKTPYAKPKKNYCVIQNDDGIPYWYSPDFDSGMGFAVYMDPSGCGADPYPFQVTQVHFYLYDPGDYLWPVEIQINIKDLIDADRCNGPGDSLHSEIYSIPSDSAYPQIINLSLNNPFYVNQPFFLEIVYTRMQDPLHPHPSLLMDESLASADTCNNWGLMDGLYYEWSEFWGSPSPGDVILRAAGYTGESSTTLPLRSGWQWVSTNVDPYPYEMENIFVNCWNDLDIIIGCDGQFCIPGVGCWIPGWNVSEMYKVHMADACTIQVYGSKVPVNKLCPLPQGWSCISYYPDCPLDPETALVSIWDNLDIVKNDDGQFCIPGLGCWIECMESNEGYKAHLASADTLIYPTECPPCPPPLTKKNSFPGFAKTTHFSYLGNTGESYSIVVNSIEFNEKQAEVGDEIGVFTPSGLCVGGGIWQGGILGIAVWQDDDRTETVDGFRMGEPMVFKLWDKSEGKEIELSANPQKGDGRFGTNAYALVDLKGFSAQLPQAYELSQNYPNPFNPETIIRFSVPEPTHVIVEVLNLLGQKVTTLVDDHREPGNYQVRWEGEDSQGNPTANGIYFCRLITDKRIIVRKMALIK